MPFLVSLLFIAGSTRPAGSSTANQTDAQALHATAKELIAQGKYAEALAPELKAAALDPNNPSIHRGLTAIYIRTNRADEAMKEALIALKLAPDDARNHFNLASLLEGSHHFDEALSEYEKAVQLGKNDLETRRGLYQCMARTERIKEAISGLQKLSQEAPDSREVWLSLSAAYLLARDNLASAQAAARAAALDPNSYAAVRMQTVASFKARNLADARRFGKQMILLDPANMDGYRLTARFSCEGNVDYDLAQWMADQAMTKQPSNINLLTFIGKELQYPCSSPSGQGAFCRAFLSAQDLRWMQLAEKVLKRALQADPQAGEANYQLAGVLTAQKKPFEAMPYAKRAYERNNANSKYKNLFLYLSSQTNDLAGALRRWLHGK